ncbi:hypothetical protein G3N57_02075 [Paraburkholderia sp. Se-20369]|nr:hypothetical protein [Paraburkholderia sp. Se-20369]
MSNVQRVHSAGSCRARGRHSHNNFRVQARIGDLTIVALRHDALTAPLFDTPVFLSIPEESNFSSSASGAY